MVILLRGFQRCDLVLMLILSDELIRCEVMQRFSLRRYCCHYHVKAEGDFNFATLAFLHFSVAGDQLYRRCEPIQFSVAFALT